MNRPVILITGARGLLGPYLCEAAGPAGSVVATSLRGGDEACDLTDATATEQLVRRVSPAVIIHSAAMTDVDGCERDVDQARRLNVDTVRNLVQALPKDRTLVQISTDQVYPDAPGPHREGSEAPVNIYGSSKLGGEQEALRHPGALVLRTNLFGPSRTPGRQSFSDFIVSRLQQGGPVTFFEDVLFSPLHMATLAQSVVQLIARGARGVFNLGSRDGTSKAEFARLVARRMNLSLAGAAFGSSASVPARAPRPHDLRLALDRVEAALGKSLPSLADEVARLVPVPSAAAKARV